MAQPLMGSLHSLILILIRPAARNFAFALDIFFTPRRFSERIFLDDKTNFFNSVFFLTTIYTYLLTLRVFIVTSFSFSALLHQFPIQITYSHEFTNAFAVIILKIYSLMLFALVSYLLYGFTRANGISIRGILHIYCYVIGAALVVSALYKYSVLVIMSFGVLISMWFCQYCDYGEFSLFYLWLNLSVAITRVSIMLYSLHVVAILVNIKLHVRHHTTIIIATLSYCITSISTAIAVLSVDAILGTNLYVQTGIGYTPSSIRYLSAYFNP